MQSGDRNQGSIDSLGAITSGQRRLLEELLRGFVATPAGVDALRFRADHDDQLSDIDALVDKLLVGRLDDKYLIRLPALAGLANPGSPAEPLWFLCNHVFKHLRALYKENPKAAIQLVALSEAADMPLAKIRKALEVLKQAPIWVQWPATLSDGAAAITPAEQIPKYKELPAVLEWFEQQRVGPASVQSRVVAPPINDIERSAKPSHAVILIHGIRTQGEWQQRARSVLEDPDITVIPTRFEFFDLISFLLPINQLRMRPVNRILRQIRVVNTWKHITKVTLICHSFGTWIAAKILQQHPDLRFHRLVLCGSVIPDGFEWDRYAGQVGEVGSYGHIVNECGMSDIWPVLAASVTWGYGSSGRFGFGHALVTDRFHQVGHSGYFSEPFIRKYWLPLSDRGALLLVN